MFNDPIINNNPALQDSGNLPYYEKLGFRFGDIGAHISRTIMLQDIEHLFQYCDSSSSREQYNNAIIEDNCLGKKTLSTRRITTQRLREHYGLDPSIPIFRIFRKLWDIDEKGRPLLAILTSLARDPILRISTNPILLLSPGEQFSKFKMIDFLTEQLESRLNTSTIDKVVRHVASSWSQSGHLSGRMYKLRLQVNPTPVVLTYALLLGYLLGFRGEALYNTLWIQVLDLPLTSVQNLALDAKRLGLLELTQAGGLVSITFNELLTEEERRIVHGAN